MRKRAAGYICLIVLLAAFGCSRQEEDVRHAHTVVTGLDVQRATGAVVPEHFAVSGTVMAKQSAHVAARIAGTVSTVSVHEGDRVTRGGLLVMIAAGEHSANAASAAHAVREAQSRKVLAEVTYERFSRLFAEQVVTRQELDTRRAERDMAEQALARAREAARSAGTIAGYARVVAPFSGIVTARLVDPGGTVFPGMPLVTLEDPGQYQLQIAVPESLLDKVVRGAAVPVTFDGQTASATGVVAEIVPQIDPASRTFMVKLAIPADGLRSGLFGKALLPVGEKRVVLVPLRAICERGQLTFVWVVDKNDIVRMRLVKTGAAHGSSMEILAGIVVGERIVVGGVDKVADGAQVR